MNICPVNSTVSSTTPSITNAKFTQLSGFVRNMGIESEIIHGVIRSGGGGLVPAMDLTRDSTLAAESFYKYRTDPSTGHKLALIGRVTEVVYDLSEMTPSVAKYFHVLSPESIETISYSALIARIAGQVILLPSCIDETLTSFGGTSRLGTKTTHQDMTWSKRTISVLTFLEAATSTISNGALLLNGPDNSIHVAASIATNSIKVFFLFLPHIFVITAVFEKILTTQKNAFLTPYPVKIKPQGLTKAQTIALNGIVKKCLLPGVSNCDITLAAEISPENGVSITRFELTPTKQEKPLTQKSKSPNWKGSISPMAKAARDQARHLYHGNGTTPVVSKQLFPPTPQKTRSAASVFIPENEK